MEVRRFQIDLRILFAVTTLSAISAQYANVTKARRMLGYAPKVNMKEGIKRFAEWYKGNK